MQPGPANKRLLELMRDVEMAGQALRSGGLPCEQMLASPRFGEISPAWLHSQMRAQAEQIRTLVEQVQQLSTALSATMQQLHTSDQRISQLERSSPTVGALPHQQTCSRGSVGSAVGSMGHSPPQTQSQWQPGVPPASHPVPSPTRPHWQTSPLPMPPQSMQPGMGFGTGQVPQPQQSGPSAHPATTNPSVQKQAMQQQALPSAHQHYSQPFTPRIEDHPAKLSRVGTKCEDKQRGLSPSWIAHQRRELANARLANARSQNTSGPAAASPASAPTASEPQPPPDVSAASSCAREGLPSFNHVASAPCGLHASGCTASHGAPPDELPSQSPGSSNLDLLAKLSVNSPSLTKRARAPGVLATDAAPAACSTSSSTAQTPREQSPNDTIVVDEPSCGGLARVQENSDVVDQRSVLREAPPQMASAGAYGWGPHVRLA